MSARSLSSIGPVARAAIVVGFFAWAFVTLFPLYWVFVTAFKPPPAVVGGPTYIPFLQFMPTMQAWEDILAGIRGDFANTFINSTIVGLSSAAIATLLGAMAAYALVRFEFRVKLASGLVFFALALGLYLAGTNLLGLGRVPSMGIAFVAALVGSILVNRLPAPGPVLGNDDIIFWFVSQRMFPPIVTAFALFLIYSEIGRSGFRLIDTYWGLTLCYIAFSLPIVVWLMRDFFAALPIELEEAAMVDNVPMWRIFVEIVMPMSAPGLAATFMISLSFVWNEFLFALFLTTSKWQTLPILVAGQNSQRGDEWWAISAAALIAIVPMMIMAALLSRLMRSGLLLGAVK